MELKRTLARAVAAACAAAIGAAHAGDYVLEIDGQKVELDLDRAASAKLGERTATIVLHQKAERTWRETGVSFQYSTATPATRQINDGVSQTAMSSPSGSIVLVQHYTNLDPTTLIDRMVNKLTDEEVQAGYTRSIKATVRTLGDGVRLSGKIAHSEHAGGGSWEREVVAVADGHGGFLVVAAFKSSAPDADRAMLDQFWRTLHLAAPGAHGADVDQVIE